LENLLKQVKELEIELKGQHRRKDREGSSNDPNYTGATLENRPIVVIRVGQGISFMKPWDIIMTLPIEIGAGIIMQLWMP